MQSSKNTIIISIVSIIAIFGFLGVVYMATNTNNATDTKDYPEMRKIAADDHVKWSKDKKNILVEYSDLQCPACKAFHDEIKSEIDTDKNITNNITFVYRHYPLEQVHQYALQASYAAEAAGKQGKFFEIADMMFDNQADWEKSDPKATFEGYAKDLKLDVDQFKKDRDSQAVKDRVARDIASGNGAIVDATPTFFLNGKKVTVNSLAAFKSLLQDTAKGKK